MGPIGPRPRLAGAAITVSLGLLLLIGALGESAAKPGLGPRGWAPGSLPWSLSSAATTAVLAAAYVLGAVGVLLALATPRVARGWMVALLAVGALVTAPFGSADHTNYAAYGRIAAQGGDPWVEPPIAWAGGTDPVTSAVEPPWQHTPSVYGPVATLGQVGAALLGADNLRQIVWIWQFLIVGAWLAIRWLLRRIFPNRLGRVDALWTLNPLVFGTAVLGAHVDILATALCLAALLAARRAAPTPALIAGLAAGLAVGVKVTAGVVLVGIVIGWLVETRPLRRLLAPIGLLALGTVIAVVPPLLWAGPHTFEQLAKQRRSISLATPWRRLYGWLVDVVPDGSLRSAIFTAAAILCLAIAWWVWRFITPSASDRVRDGAGRDHGSTAVLVTFALALAYAVGAPYTLPWYDQLVWALLPGVAIVAVDRLQIARAAVLTLAYVPGRVVEMSPDVESFTLGFRRNVAPAAGFFVWIAIAVIGVLVRRAGSPAAPSPPAAESRHGSGRAPGRP